MEQRSAAVLIPDKHKQTEAKNGATASRWRPIWKQRLVVGTLIALDASLALLIWGAASVLQGIWGQGALSDVAIATMIPVIAVWVGLRALLGLYPGYGLNSVEQLRRHTYATVATLAILAIFALGFQVGGLLSRLLLVLVFLGLLVFAPLVQYGTKWCMRRMGIWGKPVVVLSYKATGMTILESLKRDWDLGYNPVAVFDYQLDMSERSFENVDSEDEERPQALSNAIDLSRRLGVDTAIFAMPYTRREQLAGMVSVAGESFRNVLVIPNLSGVTNSAVVARDLSGTFAVEIKQNLLDPWAQRLKRTLDLFGAVVGGLCISPLLLVTAILIKLDSQGPAFYGHRRVGTGDKHFVCWKFRTMHANAEQMLDIHLEDNPFLRAEWEQNQKLRNDPRVTRVGRLLRKTSLDELPQLWNVLWGEMSLAGPRPIVDAEIPKYKTDYSLYKRIKPGMSGLWQISGRSEIDYEERVAMDAYYVRNWSVWLDIVLLAGTVKTVLLGRGAY